MIKTMYHGYGVEGWIFECKSCEHIHRVKYNSLVVCEYQPRWHRSFGCCMKHSKILAGKKEVKE